MKLRTRRIIFYLLVLVFLILGAAVTLYAAGYRLDGAGFALKKVGAIYVIASPSDADIFLDGKPVGRTNGLFERGTLIGGLFPSSHTVELRKSGYHPWKRRVSIESGNVAQISHAVLIPEDPSPVVSGNIRRFWPLNGDLLLEGATGTLSLAGTPLAVKDPLGWTRGRRGFLGRTGKKDYAFYDFRSATSTPMKPLFDQIGKEFSATSTRITVDEESESDILVTTPHALFAINVPGRTVILLGRYPTGTVDAAASSRSEIAWTVFNPASSTSRLVTYDKFLRRTNEEPVVIPGAVGSMSWGNESRLAILGKEGDLSIYDFGTSAMTAKTRGVREFAWSGDGGMLATLGTQGLEIFSEGRGDHYARFNLPNAAAITHLTWYHDGENIFLHYGDRVELLDIEDGLVENVGLAAATGYALYVPDSNILYFTSEGGVFALEFPKD